MRSLLVACVVLAVAGCGTQVDSTFEVVAHTPDATATLGAATPTATPITPTPQASIPGAVTVTFRLTLTGPVPDDAAFALQTGVVGAEGGANYLCSYYGGYPICATGDSYDEAHAFAPGTRVAYRFWRELDVNGTNEEIKANEVTVGSIDQVISVTYDFQP